MHGIFLFVSSFCLIKPRAIQEQFLMQIFSTTVWELYQITWQSRAEILAQAAQDFIRLS